MSSGITQLGTNAMRARSKVTCDRLAEALSDWTRVSEGSDTLARDAAEAIRAARSGAGQIATLIAPADTAWGKGPGPSVAVAPRPRRRAKIAAIEAAAAALRRPGAGLLIGAEALFGDHLETAGRIAAATGCRLFAHALVARQARGAGCVKVESLSPSIEQNMPLLCDLHTLVLLGALRPVSFFSYPELPSLPEPPGCHVLDLVKPHDDVPHALDALAEATGAGANIEPARWAASRPDAPRGALTPDTIGQAIASTFPEGTILIDESITAGRGFPELFATAAPHDYLRDTGGAIGFAMPLAVGAAIACPGRQVLALTGDGSAMFNLQALWTQARERLDVVNVVFANREYRILLTELKRMGVSQVGRSARFMLEMGNPALDWVAISQGHGVPAQCVDTAEDFHAALTQAFADPGPHLIEVLY